MSTRNDDDEIGSQDAPARAANGSASGADGARSIPVDAATGDGSRGVRSGPVESDHLIALRELNRLSAVQGTVAEVFSNLARSIGAVGVGLTFADEAEVRRVWNRIIEVVEDATEFVQGFAEQTLEALRQRDKARNDEG